MDVENYLKEHRPEVMEEYNRFIGGYPELKTKIITLRSGYGGLAGVERIISGYSEKYIELKNSYNDDKYLCDKDKWWKEIKIIG